MQDVALMGYFKTNLKTLMLKKSVDLDQRLNRSDIADATGLSLPTISRWYNGKVETIEAKTVERLMDYFQCQFNDLVELVDEE